MGSRDFCYWLQGFFELNGTNVTLDPDKLKMVQRHLNLVFVHEIDPSMGDQEHQDVLDQIHHGDIEPVEVNTPFIPMVHPVFGAQPGPEYMLSDMHGWYDPKYGIPRC